MQGITPAMKFGPASPAQSLPGRDIIKWELSENIDSRRDF